MLFLCYLVVFYCNQNFYGFYLFCSLQLTIFYLLFVSQVWIVDQGNKIIQMFDKAIGEWLGPWTNCFIKEGLSSVKSLFL